MSAPTRRAVLAGLSAAGLAVPALAALPAVAAGHSDAELFRIVGEAKKLDAAWWDALDRQEAISPIGGEEYEAAYSQTNAIRAQFEEALEYVYRTPAGTVKGIAAKLRAMVDDYKDDEMTFTESLALILADAERIGGAS